MRKLGKSDGPSRGEKKFASRGRGRWRTSALESLEPRYALTAPTAVDDPFTMTVDIPTRTIFVLTNDMPNSGLTVQKTSDPSHGSVVVTSNQQSFRYTPTAGFTGVDSFTYRAKNSLNEFSNVATVSITVNPYADAGGDNGPGSYTIYEGGKDFFTGNNLVLDGSLSQGPEPLTYFWYIDPNPTQAYLLDNPYQPPESALLNGPDGSTVPTLEMTWADLNAKQIRDANPLAIVTLKVVDSHNQADFGSVYLDVENVNPTVQSMTVTPTTVACSGNTVDVQATIYEPNPLETEFVVSMDWDDGTPVQPLTHSAIVNGTFGIAASHTYGNTDGHTPRLLVNGAAYGESNEGFATNVQSTIAVGPPGTVFHLTSPTYSSFPFPRISPDTYLWSVTQNGANFSLPGGTVTDAASFDFAPDSIGSATKVTTTIHTAFGNFPQVRQTSLLLTPGSGGGSTETQSATTSEGSSVQIDAVATGTPNITFLPHNGSVIWDADLAKLIYSPADGLDGPAADDFTYTVGGACPTTVHVSVQIDNAPPAAALLGPTLGIDGQILNFALSATDPSAADQAGVFTYAIDWHDGSEVESASGAGSLAVSHAFAAAGTYDIQVTAKDKDDGESAVTTFTVVVNPPSSLEDALEQLSPSAPGEPITVVINGGDNQHASDVVAAIDALPPQAIPVEITLILDPATTYSGLTASLPAGVTLFLIGGAGMTTLQGNSPALTVVSGIVVVSNVTFVNGTDSPTIKVEGGSLTVRDSVIEETGIGDRTAVKILGGVVDLGTTDSPGGNTLVVNGAGNFIRNAAALPISAIGNTFNVNGTVVTRYDIEDHIVHALDDAARGLVTFDSLQVYVTAATRGIQRAVNAVEDGWTINVAGAIGGNYNADGKLLSIRFENGPSFVHTTDALYPAKHTLTITGTAGTDDIKFTPNLGGVQARVEGYPRGTFTVTGRLVAHGLDGNDDIQVSGDIDLAAWLYGGDGDDRLKGGNGNNVLVGGSGADMLVGGANRDLLIGGTGAYKIVGNAEDDLLVAGFTNFDAFADANALSMIFSEWTSSRNCATRIANIRGTGTGERANGSVFLTTGGVAATTHDDGCKDTLTGDTGKDWYFANLVLDASNGDQSQVLDKITDLSAGDFTDDLDFINGIVS